MTADSAVHAGRPSSHDENLSCQRIDSLASVRLLNFVLLWDITQEHPSGCSLLDQSTSLSTMPVASNRELCVVFSAGQRIHSTVGSPIFVPGVAEALKTDPKSYGSAQRECIQSIRYCHLRLLSLDASLISYGARIR